MGLGLIIFAAIMGTFFFLDRLFVTSGARGVGGYAILTGIASALLAWNVRSPAIHGRIGWLLVAGWILHIGIIGGLIAAGVLDLSALASEPRPLPGRSTGEVDGLDRIDRRDSGDEALGVGHRE